MGKFAIGEIVSVLFPFSNLKGQKVRPALILAKVEFSDLILCQITSRPYTSKAAIRIDPKDFVNGQLPVISFVRPDKLFTANETIIKSKLGQLRTDVVSDILQNVRKQFVRR